MSSNRRKAIGRLVYWLHTWPRRYGFALMTVAVATLLRLPLATLVGPHLLFVLFYPAIFLVAWMAGIGPGIFAVFLSGTFASYLFFQPVSSSALGLPRNVNGLFLFSVVGVAISVVARVYRQRVKRVEEFEKAVEGLEEMIVVVDRNYRCIIANRAYLMYRGIKREDLLGRRIPEILNSGDFETTVKQKLDECFQRKIVQYEIRHTYSSRGVRDLLVSNFPIEGLTGVDRVVSVLQDVTERKEAERSLTLFRRLIDESNDAVEVADPATLRLLDVNDKACKDLGYTRAELLSLSVYDIDPTAEEAFHATVLAGLQETGSVVKESVHRRKDGTVFPVEISLKYVQLDRGYVVAVSRDITERKRAEKALLESDARFRALADFVPQMVWMCTPDGLNVYFNQRWVDYTGMSMEESYGRGWNTPFHADDKQRAWEAWNRAVATGEMYQVESRLQGAGGGYRWFLMQGVPLRDASGSIVKWFGSCTDIEDMKRAEVSLRESEARLNEAQHNAHIGSWRYRPGEPFIFSDEMYELFKLARDVPPTYEALLSALHPEDRAPAAACFQKQLESGAHDFQNEDRVVWPDGQVRNTFSLGKILRDADGRVTEVVGTSQDVTERKRAQETLRTQAEQLRALSARLQKAREEERTVVARELHDEIGQMLTALKLEISWIDRRLSTDQKEMRGKIESIRTLVDTGAKWVRKVCTQLRPSILDDLGLAPAIEWQAHEFELRTGIGCKASLPAKLTAIDPERTTAIFRILQESLTNVSRHAEASQVYVSLQEQDHSILLAVSDNGKGIQDADMALHGSFGLLGMQERALAFGGHVDFSARGQGTTVSVCIPLPNATEKDLVNVANSASR